jgi:simple sugar transport system ATP-binding protein
VRIDWRAERARLAAFMASAPFPLPLEARVARLSAGEKQKLEILKALVAKRRFLVLDEPTSVLTPQEADDVLGRIRDMCRASQLTVLIITHKFREVFGYCDEVTVLRRGQPTGAARTADTTRDELAGWMMGAPAEAGTASPAGDRAAPAGDRAAPAGDRAAPARTEGPGAVAPRLAVQDLRVNGEGGRPAIDGLSLQVRPGEIVGIAGVAGNGQRELVAALTGVMGLAGGTLAIDGEPFRPTRAQMERHGVRSLPEEPLHNACVGRLSVGENLALRNFDRPPLARGPWLSSAAIKAQALRQIVAFKIKAPGPEAPIETLSGGNVQRAVLARELSEEADVLIVANPVFGLDFAAVAEIHQRLMDVRNRGGAVLLISEDLDELLALSDRVLVMSEGRIVHETRAADADRNVLGAHMGGGHHAPAEAEAVAA